MWTAYFKPACAAIVLMGLAGGAAAAGNDAKLSLDEFTVIAGGWQLERRCNHLNATRHDELSRIVAHAEIDVAKRHGGAKIKKVLSAADQFGEEKGANCGNETARAVKGAYAVAERWASAKTAATERAENKRTAEKKRRAEKKRLAEEERVKRRKEKQRLAKQRRDEQREANRRQDEQLESDRRRDEQREADRRRDEQRQAEREAEDNGENIGSRNRTLVRFGAQTRAYYLDLRCKHLPYKQALRFWKLIARKHRALTRRHGAGTVNRVSRRAKASAKARCGATTRRLVQRGLAGIRRDIQ